MPASSNLRGAAGLALLVLGALAALAAQEPGQPLPVDDEERQEMLLHARRIFTDNCLMCHAEEMTTRQRLTPKQWETEVDKMIGWGAPVAKEDRRTLIDYLAGQYSTEAATTPPIRRGLDRLGSEEVPEATAIPDGDPARGRALYATNCANCHGPDALGGDLGTNLVARPILLRPGAYQEVVRQGRRRMPGFAAVLKPAEEVDVLAWLRTSRAPVPAGR